MISKLQSINPERVGIEEMTGWDMWISLGEENRTELGRLGSGRGGSRVIMWEG